LVERTFTFPSDVLAAFLFFKIDVAAGVLAVAEGLYARPVKSSSL
jgi:hypothetical protein